MTKGEVIKLLGQPVSVSAQENCEYLNYKLSETDKEALRGITTPYYVKVINGRVGSYGRTGDFAATEKPATRVVHQTAKVEKPAVKVEKNDDAAMATQNEPELYTELKKLKELRDEGILTEKEYEVRKKKILVSQLGPSFIHFWTSSVD